MRIISKLPGVGCACLIHVQEPMLAFRMHMHLCHDRSGAIAQTGSQDKMMIGRAGITGVLLFKTQIPGGIKAARISRCQVQRRPDLDEFLGGHRRLLRSTAGLRNDFGRYG
jgi:hypothetical protein